MQAAGLEARRFLRRCDSGALSTLSVRHAGYPFGSVVSFVPDASGSPLILVSRLAEHSRNLAADPRASLLVRDSAQDVLGSGRVTVVSRAESIDGEDALEERFVRYSPGARRLLDLGDFYFLRLRPVVVRYIGGFGSIHWVAAEDFISPTCLAAPEVEVVDALQRGHTQELKRLCSKRLQREAQAVELIGVDCDGFDARADGARLRFDFAASASDMPGIVAELTALAQAAG